MKDQRIKEFLIDTKYLWKSYILTSCISLLMIFSGLLLPIVLQKLIDEGITACNIKNVFVFVAAYIACSLIQTGSMHFVNVKYALISKSYCIETKKKMFQVVNRFSGEDIQKEKSGKLIHMIEEDINDISVTVTDKIFQIANDFITAIFSFFMLLYISPTILAVVFVLQLILFRINKSLSNKVSILTEKNFTLRDEQGSSLQEFMMNLDYLVGSNLISYFAKKYIKKENKLTDIRYEIEKTISVNFCSQSLINTITKCMNWGCGGIFVIWEKITIGKLFSIDAYAGKLVSPVYRIIDNNLELKKLFLEIERVYSFLNQPFVKEQKKEADLKGKFISFQNVSFSYDKKNEILQDFDVKIYPNKVNVFVGKSGQGKSTIIKLLIGMWKIDAGHILIGKTDLYDFSQYSIRNQIGMVSQDIPIFNATIMENLVLSGKYSMEEMIQTCKRTGIYEEIMNMEEQFDTMISEYGRNLSGGQKQRIAITRVLLEKAEVIIFDEPTSGLDYENKMRIKNLIYDLGEKTVILITHDKDLIESEGYLNILKNGKIQEGQ